MNYQQFTLSNSFCRILQAAVVIASLAGAVAYAQNPVPQIVGPLKPMAVAPGSGAFTLTVYGANFVPGAVVTWNAKSRVTTFVSSRELQAQILASDVVKNTAGLINVTNPAPGGGNSSTSWAQVEVHKPISTITLKQPRIYPFGFYLVLPADFNHDGILDLAGQYGPYVDFNPGKGDGTFHFGSIAGRYYNSNGAAFGDFNGDGNLDIVFGELPPDSTTATAAVVLGDGQGKFKFRSSISNRNAPTFNAGFILAGDFNGDGKLDILGGDLHGFSVFLGKGDGTFRHLNDIAQSHFYVTGILAGDFNGDGKLDVALASTDDNGTIYVYLYAGNGDGTFQPVRTIYANTALQGGGLSASDLNGDGNLDLVFHTDSQICILLGNGDGTFQPPTCYTVGAQSQFTYTIGDINSDGKPDLIVSNYSTFNDPELDVLLGNGDGTFESQQTVASGTFGELGIVVGDFNGDGALDVIFQTGGGAEVFIQQ